MTSPIAFAPVAARIRHLSDPNFRRRERCFWMEGVRNFIQAYDANWQLETIVWSPILLQSDQAEMLARRRRQRGVTCCKVSPEVFRSVSKSQRASGIGAIVRQRWTDLESVDPAAGIGWLIVDDLQSPGNLGTMIRTLEACGGSGLILLNDRVDPFDPVVVRACMGSLFHLPIVHADRNAVARWALQHDVQIIGLSPHADRLWTDVAPAGAVALLIGHERTGIASKLTGLCRTSVRLPMVGRADSLNVSIAAGVMLYELVRARQSASMPDRG